ncbi:DUF5640 domain-containing protein [Zunongwangia endophytica]|uniref:DUF5640 domain-containing protein n=1 Tax=Zunongwangia endophytica TaxID=1808945 RepID=A0ABV8H553_9FLAO|nr:DUF5640 domain-containing protein [Zunongwangia endophytica]MDN3596153.1 DUF5640 domain-containing protein [Zunongwangia endophytica]
MKKLFFCLGILLFFLTTSCNSDDGYDADPDLETRRKWLVNENEWKFSGLNFIDVNESDPAIIANLEQQLKNSLEQNVYIFNEDGTGSLIARQNRYAFNFKVSETEITLTGGIQDVWNGYDIDNGALTFFTKGESYISGKNLSYAVRLTYK